MSFQSSVCVFNTQRKSQKPPEVRVQTREASYAIVLFHLAQIQLDDFDFIAESLCGNIVPMKWNNGTNPELTDSEMQPLNVSPSLPDD